MALKFQPPQGIDTTSPNEAFNKGLGNSISNLPLLYQQMKQAHMENQLKERTLAAQLEQNQFTRGIEEKKVGIQQQEADTNRYKAENQPQYTVPVYDASGNVTGFQEVPKGFKPFGGKQPQKPNADESTKEGAQKRVSGNLETLKDLYQQLSEKGGMVDAEKKGIFGAISNASARTRASAVGQLGGEFFGTEEQSIRNQIKQIKPLLIQDIRQASKMGARGLDSEKELQFYLQAATDEKRDIQANLKALDVLDKAYGLGLGVSDNNSKANKALPSVGETFQGGKVLSIKKIK